MDEQLARTAILNAAGASREIAKLARPLAGQCEADLHAELKLGIGTVVHEIYASILGPIFARFPHLKAEFERNIER